MGKIGKYTFEYEKDIRICGYGNVVGKFEGEGPLSVYFDTIIDDEYFGEDSYEKAETKLQKFALSNALKSANIELSQLDLICGGDLLNQCISSGYAVRNNGTPFIGVYGACSTMALSTIVSSIAVECGIADYSAGCTSSHFCSAERQFRQPLEYGGQRTPTAQRTVTAGASVVVSRGVGNVKVKRSTIGKVIDYEITDANNMGAAMAPAFADTLANFLIDTNTEPSDYDLILSGDLGIYGAELTTKLVKEKGFTLNDEYNDCGAMIFDKEKQDTHAGGSGCGCSGAVLTGYVLPKISNGELSNVIFMSTGALMSPTACMQGESIPSVAHLIHLTGV